MGIPINIRVALELFINRNYETEKNQNKWINDARSKQTIQSVHKCTYDIFETYL